MAMSSGDISPVRGSSSSASSECSQIEQKKLMFCKKKLVGPAKKRVARRTPMMNLTKTSCKKTSPLKSKYKKTLQEAIDNTRNQAINKTTKLQAIDNTKMSQQGCSQVEMNSPAMDRAKEVQSKLPPQYPSFVKYMLKSHVTGGFWLGLPKSFCYMHMPKQDKTFSLVGEDVEEHRAKYLVEKHGLSGGWRGFSLLHKLVEGDVLVFQLIESLKFQVYIMRASENAEIDGAIGLLDLVTQAKSLDDIDAHNENEVEEVKNIEMITVDKCEMGSRQKDGMGNGLDSEPVATLQQTGNRSDELGPENVEGGIRMANKSVLEFKDVKGFDSFNILVDGLIIDTEIPIHLRYKYYKLCCNQKSFLHDDLVKGLNCKLAAGIICETVNIADAITVAAKVTVSSEHVVLQSWDKTLKAFEDMGMRVGFLRTCLNKLICLSYEQHEMIRSKKTEQARLEEEIRDLESKLSKRREVKRRLEAEIAALMTKDLSVEITFKNIS